MNFIKRLFWVLLITSAIVAHASADESFVIKNIKVEGLQRIALGTVLNYVPVQVGQTIEAGTTANIIRALYKTGFFSHVEIQHLDDNLIIKVKERPTIGSIQITGNSLLGTDVLKDSLKNIGLAQGRVYDKAILDNIQSSLQNQYYDQGHYSAGVTTSVTPESQNRVAISIVITEGSTAKIHHIKIIGNHAFSETKLLRQFALSKAHFWDFFSKKDQYSKEKLDADLETLKSFYLDQGYINFKIDSAQVSITPDKKQVYIVIHITEGPQFRLKGFDLSGQLALPKEDLRRLVAPLLIEGEVFSRKQVTQATTVLGDYLGDYGYSFAIIRPLPELDEEKKEVFVNLLVEPGHRIYVRRINFSGNTKTEDVVLRREMRQQEGAIISLEKIKLSEKRLRSLGYFKNVGVNTRRVAEAEDEVDLDFQVIEAASANITAGAGYSDTRKFIFNAGFNQPNFLGTGNSVGLNFAMDRYTNSLSGSYYDPYYTKDGVGRGISLYASTADYVHSNVSPYEMDQYGGNVFYSWPLSEHNSMTMGYGYQITNLNIKGNIDNLGPNPAATASLELLRFKHQHGEHFRNLLLTTGWSYVNYDRAIYPRRGYGHTTDVLVAIPASSSSLNYYQANYTGRLYQPLFDSDFILTLRGELGYGDGWGDGQLPFYQNYRAGGIGVQGELRGFKGYSVGPKDSLGNNLGGNFLVDGTIGLIIPSPIAKDAVRPMLFFDFGNVWTNVTPIVDPRFILGCDQDPGPLRTSVGLSVEWRSPIGPLIVALAKPLNKQGCDNTETLQFTVSTGG